MQLSPRFEAALQLAVTLHEHQMRKGGVTPYIAHLMIVAGTVLDYGGGEDDAIAALLHDAVEDQGGLVTLARIRTEFGDGVADTVWACSDSHTPVKPPWRERKERFVAALPQASAAVRLIMAADKLHNVRSITKDYRVIGERVWARFTGGRDGTLWYYRAALDALKLAANHALVQELERAVIELETLVAGPMSG